MINRLPLWFRQNIPGNIALSRMHLLSELGVNTVCSEARCPNFGDCFSNLRLTFMILGDICTRNCKFCGVEKSNAKLLDFDLDEPGRIAGVVGKLGLKYVVLTSVSRDDLEDGGTSIFARTIELIHALNKGIKVEVLIPDFKGKIDSIKRVLDAHPQVIAHNIETVKRLYGEIRPKANYELSLGVLREIKRVSPTLVTKSSLMLGLGEREEEVKLTMQDLRGVDCDIITLGQYLAPSQNHYPVQEFISWEKFMHYREMGIELGFKAVLSGPLVRSSYQAEEVYNNVKTMSHACLPAGREL